MPSAAIPPLRPRDAGRATTMAFYFMPGRRAPIAACSHATRAAAVAAMTASPDPLPRAAPSRAVVQRADGWAMRLRRHLRWVIAIKLLLIGLLFALFFSSPHRPDIDPDGVSDRLQLGR